MINDMLVAELEDRIARNRGLLDVLERGNLHEGDGPRLRGEGDRTTARIEDLKRLIAIDEMILDSVKNGAN